MDQESTPIVRSYGTSNTGDRQSNRSARSLPNVTSEAGRTEPNNNPNVENQTFRERILSKIYPMGFKRETKNLLKLAFPMIVTNMFTFLIMTESVIFSSFISSEAMGGVALGNSIINALALAVATGLSSACDTFFSQIYGSENKSSLGMMLQRSLLITSIFAILITALLLNMQPLFMFMQSDAKVAEFAALHMLLFSPGILFAFHFLVLARYMQNQDRVFPPMFIVVAGNVFNSVAQYVCIAALELGFNSSGIIQMLTYFFMLVAEILYIYFSKLYKETWNGWRKEAFLDWGNFLSLGIPGAAMVVMETFCWEIGTVLSSIMGSTQLGAQAVLFQLETIVFQIALGVSIAVNIRVGQNLGSMRPKKALTAYRCGMTIMLLSSLITGILFISLSNYLPRIFSKDEEIIRLSSSVLLFLIFVQLTDSLSCVTLGALRGCGRQKLGTLFIFLSYYILGQPIGITLAFKTDLSIKGFWIGLLCALIIMMPVGVIITNRMDWKEYAKKARKRIRAAHKSQQRSRVQQDERSSLVSTECETEDGRSSVTSEVYHDRMPTQPLLSSLSLSTAEFTDPTTVNFTVVLLKRFAVFFVVLALLAASLTVRFTVNFDRDNNGNSTTVTISNSEFFY